MGLAFLVLLLLLVGSGLAVGAYEDMTQFPDWQKWITYRDSIASYSDRYQVPAKLMVAIITHESDWDPNAVNGETKADQRLGRNVESLGLGQILYPDTADTYSPGSLREWWFDPDFNIQTVARILSHDLHRYSEFGQQEFPVKTVSAYNAGSYTTGNAAYVNAVRSIWNSIPDDFLTA